MTEHTPREAADETAAAAKKRGIRERRLRRAAAARDKLTALPVMPVWASQVVFEAVTGIKRRRAYELAACGRVRTKKDGTATRWHVGDGLAYVESLPSAEIKLSPAQRRKLAEQERASATDKSAS